MGEEKGRGEKRLEIFDLKGVKKFRKFQKYKNRADLLEHRLHHYTIMVQSIVRIINFFLLLCGALWDEPLEIGFMGSFLQLLEQKKKKGCTRRRLNSHWYFRAYINANTAFNLIPYSYVHIYI